MDKKGTAVPAVAIKAEAKKDLERRSHSLCPYGNLFPTEDRRKSFTPCFLLELSRFLLFAHQKIQILTNVSDRMSDRDFNISTTLL